MRRWVGWAVVGWLAAGPLPAQVGPEDPAAQITVITAEHYRRALVELQGLLRHGTLDEAHAAAGELLASRLAYEDQELEVDRSALVPALEADSAVAARQAARRLQPLVDALGGAPDLPETTASDEGMLAELRRQQEVAELESGGEVANLDSEAPGFFQRAMSSLVDAMVWLWLKLEQLVEWLLDLWPDRAKPGETGLSTWLVVTLVLVAAALLTFLALRRRGRGASSEELTADSVPPPLTASSGDIDPLSRETDEWRRYALQLAAEGRHREAVRAWYHAVLVSLYRAGLLHYRRGRTNWEYVSALGPDLEWRRDFMALTRSFETEWYGRRQTPPDALEACAAAAENLLAAVSAGRRRPE